MDHKFTDKQVMGNHRYNKRLAKPQSSNKAYYEAWGSGRIRFGQMPLQAQQYTERRIK